MSQHDISANFATFPEFGVDRNGNIYARFTAREFVSRNKTTGEKKYNFWFSTLFDRPEANILQAAELVARVQRVVNDAREERCREQSIVAYDAVLQDLAYADILEHEEAHTAAEEAADQVLAGPVTDEDLIEGVFAFHGVQWRMWGQLSTDLYEGKQNTQFNVRGIAESLEFSYSNRVRENQYRPELQEHVMKRALENVKACMNISLPVPAVR